MKINNQVISLFNSNFFIKEDDIVFLVFEICSKLNYKCVPIASIVITQPFTLTVSIQAGR